MKKKLLTVLFVALLACLFAFTVSAANEVTLTDGTQADLATVFKINSSNQVTGFNSGYDKNMVTDVIFPDEIEGLEANYLFGSSTSIKTITFAATDTFFISGDGIFSKCSVEKITFNENCLVEIRKGNFAECKSLTEITFPKFTKLAGSAFGYCNNMKSTNELVLAEGLTEIGGHAFHDCTSLTGTLVFPSTLVKIQEYSFQNTGFTAFDLSKCANLTTAGGGYGGPFTGNDNITTLDLSGCTSLTYLKNSFASDCDKLETVILPPNLETIQSKAFAHCYKMQSIVLPATLESIADEAFHSARRGQTVMTFTVYVQSNVVMGASYPFRDSGAKIEYILIGDGVTAKSFIEANVFSGVTGATVVDYYNAETKTTYTVGQTISAHTIVEGYCKSLALTGAHKSGDNPCVINCETCAVVEAKENPEHTLTVVITYENGYDNAGVKITSCANTGCTHKVTADAMALFVCVGYSVSEANDGGVSLGYKVNNDAILEYAEVNKSEVRYGLFAAARNTLGDKEVLNENDKAATGAVVAEIPLDSYIYIAIKMVGFKTEELKAADFALGAYFIVDNGVTTERSYMQESKPNENELYSFVTFNQILDKFK